MNKTLQFLASSLMLLTVAQQAHAVVIEDTYIGSNDHGYGDRIGTSRYEVYNMDVNFIDGYMNVRVNTNFTEVGDPYGIKYGDLFISTNGWNPYGSAPYKQDNAKNGEKWEFVFDTSKGLLYGGAFSVYLSDNLMSPYYTFRNGQEVQRKGGGTALKGSAVDLSHAGKGGYIEYHILMSSLGITGDSIGLKWGMTCANDTIEGAVKVPVKVPEAGGLAMLLLGLLGLAMGRRRTT